MNDECQTVLRQFRDVQNPTLIESLGSAGGFSGARLYRISVDNQRYCLRRWPCSHPSPTQLRFIHDVLQLARGGCGGFIPVPLRTGTAETFVSHAGHLWELTPWMPGEADYHRHPCREKLIAAMTALATFHLETCKLPTRSPLSAPAPGIADRLQRLDHLAAGGLTRLADAVDDSLCSAFAQRSYRLLGMFPLVVEQVRRHLTAASSRKVPLGPCIRDVWHDHLLFSGNRLTGLVDFGAMQIDNVATDIARLVGSLVGDEATSWEIALDAYDQVRPLSVDERLLIVAYDQSGVLMSGLSWVNWIFRERRTFDQTDAILIRLDNNIRRLTHLASRG